MSSAAMHIARTGLDAQDMRMRVISNNLANVNTTGFKKDRAAFETLAYQTVTTPGTQSTAETKYATGLNLGTGVRIQGTARIDTQGAMQTTGNSLDLALDGDGYFQVQMPGGTLGYTRAGNFSRSAEGLLVTSEGYQLQPGITVPPAQSVKISADGTISIVPVGGDANAPQVIDTLKLASPKGTETVKGLDNLLHVKGGGVLPQDLEAKVASGSLEGSNVNMTQALVDMIENQRSYEVQANMMKSAKDMDESGASLMRLPS